MTRQPVLKEHYLTTVIPELKKTRGYKNIHQVPFIEKIVVSTGLNADSDKSWIAEVTKDIGLITGQKPVATRARKSISNFKLRQGMVNGLKVTLRNRSMYEFLYRLISVTLCGIRDFRGVSNRLDLGNYNLGIADHTIFPEISIDTNKKLIGMNITIVTSAKTSPEAKDLLTLLGIPFRKATGA
jgi:large subunit ribosomal protein L5